MKNSLIIAIFSIIIAIFSLTACGKEKKEIISKQIEKEDSYQPTYQTLSLEMEAISSAVIKEERIYLYGNKWVEDENEKEMGGKSYLYLASMKKDGSDLKEKRLEGLRKKEAVLSLVVDNRNQLYIVTQEYKKDRKTKTEGEIYRFHLVEEEGNLGTVIELKRKKKEQYELTTRNFTFLSDKLYVLSNTKMYCFNQKGKIEHVYDAKESLGEWLFSSADGKLYLCGWMEDGESGRNRIREFDLETETFCDPMDFGDYTLNEFTILRGEGSEIFLNDRKNMYRYNLANGEIKTELTWLNADLDGEDGVRAYFPLKDGTILVITRDDSEDAKIELITFQKVEASKRKEKKTLLYAGITMEYPMKKKILEFNKKNQEYRIETKDYSIYDDPAKQLSLDIISGKVPDILDITWLSKEQLIKKGLFLDLYDFMEKDKEIKKEDFIPSVLKTLENDGKLYFLPSSFQLKGLVSSKKLMKDKESWTISEMIDSYEAMPENRVFMQYADREWIGSGILRACINDYIDWETGNVNFQTDEIIKLIEFSNQFPSVQEADYSQMEDKQILIEEGRLFLEPWYLSQPADILEYTKQYQKQGGYTVLSYPSNSENKKLDMVIYDNDSILTITKQCEYTEGAWEFVRQFLTYEYQKEKFHYNFPTRKDVLEKKLKAMQATKPYTDEDGMEILPLDSGYGFERPLNKKEIKQIRSFIDRIGGIATSYHDMVNETIAQILEEELEAFYAGDKTAEEAAEIIENRVGLYISESS